jgi:glycosyltransferase involved in cell wall biosynthesis
LNLLEIATNVPPYKGGISRLVGLLSEGLERQGHKVDILGPKTKIKFKELKISSVPFHRYNDYDLIHLHGPTPFLSDLTFMTNHKTPIIYTHHAEICWLSEKISKIYRDFHRLLAKRSRGIIVHSHDYARLFKGANVFVVRMPSAIKHPGNFDIKKKADSFTVLYVGQLRPFKGIDILVQAASLLRDVTFVFVGGGYLKSNLEKMAENLKNVRFVGAVTDEELMRLYEQAHVICLPSINTTEAYGLALIEGASYGCVPLASNLIGVRENVAQLNGLLFEPGSYISLSKRIRMLSNDVKLWVDFANRSQSAACKYVSTYTPEFYVRKHEALFRKCL